MPVALRDRVSVTPCRLRCTACKLSAAPAVRESASPVPRPRRVRVASDTVTDWQ